MKKLGLLLLVLALAGGVAWYLWHEQLLPQQQAQTKPAPAARVARVQSVAVHALEPRTITLSQSLPGRIAALRQSQVRPQVDGIVAERLFEEGSSVERGQQLYQIDDARYRATLNSALADLQSARANVEAAAAKSRRYADLVRKGAVSKQDYDDVKAQHAQARAEVAVAEASVDLARVNLGYTKVYAPIGGRIGRSLVTEGGLVTANQAQPLAVITQLDPVYVDMQQSSREALELRSRLDGRDSVTVRLRLDEGSQDLYPHPGVLKFSEVTVDQSTGSVTLRAEIPNPEQTLLPGLFVRGVLELGETEALLVPQRATTRTQDGTLTVWVVGADSIANPRSLTVSRAYEDSWVVQSGLEAGDTIIIEGYQKIAPGSTVKTEPWNRQQTALGTPLMAANRR